jgi:colicin import membrane protein
MSTVTGSASGSGPYSPENDPFIHGVRNVPRTLEDGTVVYDAIPLRQEDLLFPEEWDHHVITEGHRRDCKYLQNVFERQLHGVEGARVLGDLRVDWSHAEIRPMGPDVVVVRGAHVWRDWSTFDVVKEGATTALIVEVTSPDTRKNDLIIKRDLYYQVGVSYYAIVDRRERRGVIEVSVAGYHRGASAFEQLPRNDRGWIWLEPVGVWLGVDGDRAVCYQADGTLIADYTAVADERDEFEKAAKSAVQDADAERARAEAAVQAAAAERTRAEAAVQVAAAERTRAETAVQAASVEQERADAERERADAEARSRAALEARMREMEAELHRLRGEI